MFYTLTSSEILETNGSHNITGLEVCMNHFGRLIVKLESHIEFSTELCVRHLLR